jgi:hypothetical protein
MSARPSLSHSCGHASAYLHDDSPSCDAVRRSRYFLTAHPTVPADDGRQYQHQPLKQIQATPIRRYPAARRNSVQAFKFAPAPRSRSQSILFSLNRQSFRYQTFTSASLPIRYPVQHRILFFVLCIHICAMLGKDPSKFHMSLELARFLLERGADMEVQDDNGKRIPLLLWVASGICRPCSYPSQTRRTYRSREQI